MRTWLMSWVWLWALVGCRTEPLPAGGATPVTPVVSGVACGTLTCSRPTSACCSRSPDQAGTCIAPGSPCGTFEFACDDPSDCQAGEVCCLIAGLTPPGSHCMAAATCAQKGLERCLDDGDCSGGKSCQSEPEFQFCS